MDQIELKRGVDHRAIEIPRERGGSYEAAFSGARAVLDEWERDGPVTAAAATPALERELATAGKMGGQRAAPPRKAAKRPAKKKARR